MKIFVPKVLCFGLLLASLSFSCSQKAQCPAYMDPSQGTISVQDEGDLTAQQIRDQSIDLLESQDYYIRVKRSKKTGLVKNRKKVKKGKNKTAKHKGFKKDPRTLQGVTVK